MDQNSLTLDIYEIIQRKGRKALLGLEGVLSFTSVYTFMKLVSWMSLRSCWKMNGPDKVRQQIRRDDQEKEGHI